MEIFSLPTAKYVGMLPRVLEKLDKDFTNIDGKGAQVTTAEKVRAWATASVALFLVAAFDEVKDVVLLAVKIVPISLNETLGRATGLSKYVTSPALAGSELRAHVNNIVNALVIQVNAVLIFAGLQSPNMSTIVGRGIKVFPVAQPAQVDKPADNTSQKAPEAVPTK